MKKKTIIKVVNGIEDIFDNPPSGVDTDTIGKKELVELLYVKLNEEKK